MTTTTHRQDRGVTLLELLVVLMILSIVLTAAVRTWDVTLERGRAETTARKMDQLVKVIVGDADYIVAGQRADFGFVGDEGRLPVNLQELVVRPASDSVWRGPYIRSTFNQSVDGYRIDGWGDTMIYGYEVYRGLDKESLWVRSYGGRGVADRSRWMTRNFPVSYDALTQNTVEGQLVDVRNDPVPANLPAAELGKLRVLLYYPSDGKIVSQERIETGATKFTFPGIPVGTAKLVAMYMDWGPPRDSLMTIQEVPVYPVVGARHITIRLQLDWDDLPLDL